LTREERIRYSFDSADPLEEMGNAPPVDED